MSAEIPFYTKSYYQNIFLYVRKKRTGEFTNMVLVNFVLGLTPVLVISAISFFYVGMPKFLKFYGDGSVIIVCSSIIVTYILKLTAEYNEVDFKEFRTTLQSLSVILLLICFGFFIFAQLDDQKTITTRIVIIFISFFVLVATFAIVFFVHFCNKIDYLSDVQTFIDDLKRKQMMIQKSSLTEGDGGIAI